MFPAGKENIKIALIYPSLTKDILYKTNSSFKPTEEWELFFLSRSYDYEMLNDDDLDGISTDVSVVVVPSMEAVSEEMLDELKQLMDDGKGILITGNFAAYDENGKKRTNGEGSLPGFEISTVGGNEKLSVNHFLEGSTPFSAGLKPGQKILLSISPSLFYASGLSAGANPEGSYILPGNEFPGIVSNSVADGRLLWFGFNINQLIDKNREIVLFNSLKWLSSQPEAFINYWPADHAFSVVFYENIERSNNIDSSFTYSIKYAKSNYFISASLLEKFQGRPNDISDSGNINILWDDFRFSRLDSGEKSDWLKKIHSQIHQITGQDHFGVSSYGEFNDPDTHRLLRETGYSFIFSAGYSDSYTFNYDTLNNIYLFNRNPADPGIRRMLKSEVNPGGIFYIDKDSAGSDLYSLLTRQNCWITTFSGLIDWTQKRESLSVNINHSEGGGYNVIIRNDNKTDIKNAGLWISVPYLRNTQVSISGQERELTFDTVKKMYFLNLSSIGGYQKISFNLPTNE